VLTIAPEESKIQGVTVIPRIVHHDQRGSLVETMRHDDEAVAGAEFAMSYASLTLPGQMRDVDRWHIHHHQTDRFVVLVGEMVLALYDPRPNSPTRGRLEAIRMAGANDTMANHGPSTKRESKTFLVTVPIEVCHCIGNLSREPFLLQNYPTKLYDAADEGRIPFSTIPIDGLGNGPFGWDKVEVRRP
jgi:dTDP-4-dehydrorhamnose 3,5-epimerase